jgi:hypothetical protein
LRALSSFREFLNGGLADAEMKSGLKDTAKDLMNAAIQNNAINAAPSIVSFGIGVGLSVFGYYLAA